MFPKIFLNSSRNEIEISLKISWILKMFQNFAKSYFKLIYKTIFKNILKSFLILVSILKMFSITSSKNQCNVPSKFSLNFSKDFRKERRCFSKILQK